jgi:NADPH-dependent 2,4-dienoyl-CoA reductase/sulfur reductase-like enzyme
VDVAVVGAGPAGLAAATAAAEAGARVLMIDQEARPGGQIWRHRAPATLPAEARRVIDRWRASGAAALERAAVVDAAPGWLGVALPDRVINVRARAIVLATGARELLLPFPGWTLPNVFGVGGMQALIKSGLDVRRKRVVIAGSGPLILPVAATAARHGARVLSVAEQADGRRVLAFAASLWRSPSKLAAAARYRLAFRRARFHSGVWIERAEGSGRVERVTLTDGARRWSLDCDLVAAACGLVPNVEIGMVLGCALGESGLRVDAAQQTSVSGVFAAGECTGIGGEELALVEGTIAGLAAMGRGAGALAPRRARLRGFAGRLNAAFAPRAELLTRADAATVVCRCEDVRMADLRGAGDAREAKLATRAGMGPCQGRVCGTALQQLFGWELPVPRLPLSPVPAAALRDLEQNS